MTVRQLLSNLDSFELTEWMAFDQLEAIGEARADLRAGIVSAAVGNHGYRSLPQPYKASDFMPYLQHEAEKPLLLNDPQKQSDAILRLVFHRK
ncbi:Uncharacterised protein [Burkholderia pseudomallei]|uniref:DUF4035 domain-containing protein n=1 Tax=Burkholderia pseudomallei TaxID=28450 RepID=UPI0009C99483|nr:DUF4035 domain-containing protein [Burkholderia pseudomallei]OMS46590.1 hypothetical protein AQ740_17985 [Burkholderia pseudomallei]CAJ3065624.1 Uncharacterised protein [Burkholderia pseudomallei]CAJ3073310.1 Uncharacterised protein [Burkholderia pseudomallei]CAJ3703347.1 Uncharacterised protein [Burkholderia pseudomallei]CAJ3729343.1 Uncharacterised protein [Burkholderia pseudomallei]